METEMHSKQAALNYPARSYRSILAHYYKHIIPMEASVLEIGCGSGELLKQLPNRDVCGVDISLREIEHARTNVPWGTFICCPGEQLQLDRKFDYIVLSETINESPDVQELFDQLRRFTHTGTRLVINFFNSVWRPVLRLAEVFRLKAPSHASNWLSTSDVINLLRLTEWDPIRIQAKILFPFQIPILNKIFNAYLAPLLPPICLTIIITARVKARLTQPELTVSVIIPARNEAGTIEEAVLRTPEMGGGTELVFVEGHSTDNTWDEIQRVHHLYPEKNMRILRQSGNGKGNAVREGFSAASGDILMILDADLTVPPEDLPKFYSAIVNGHAEFANGVRLVYPMRDGAMRFANMCANKGFSLVFTFILGQPVKDTLCGTKVLLNENYKNIVRNRAYFGDFDPFGDFDLLFGADKLNMKICDIPIRYHERTYGTTNIQRWRHGVLLLRMVIFAAQKLKFV